MRIHLNSIFYYIVAFRYVVSNVLCIHGNKQHEIIWILGGGGSTCRINAFM